MKEQVKQASEFLLKISPCVKDIRVEETEDGRVVLSYYQESESVFGNKQRIYKEFLLEDNEVYSMNMFNKSS